MSKPTIGSLFSGIGGIDLAFQQAGFDIAYQVEIDDYCQQVLAKHWPGVQRYGDIFRIDTLPSVDVMAGGFPCQPVSHAGKRKGEQDERWLWPEFYRLIASGKPRVVFLENVPGLRTIDGGDTFKQLLRDFDEIGYDVQWSYFWATDIGSPHSRERVFIVAHTNSQPRKRDGTNRQQIMETRSLKTKSQGLDKRRITRRKQSRLGRGPHGLFFRLDRHQFPAPPGPQYAWEPPRTTTQTENRANRLKALGNAVVPQVVYPIALAIYEWLEGEHV